MGCNFVVFEVHSAKSHIPISNIQLILNTHTQCSAIPISNQYSPFYFDRFVCCSVSTWLFNVSVVAHTEFNVTDF